MILQLWKVDYDNLKVNNKKLVSCYKASCSLWLWLASCILGAATAIRQEANIKSRPQSPDYYTMVREGPENLVESNF